MTQTQSDELHLNDNRAVPPALPRFGYRQFMVGRGVNLPTLIIANLKLELARCRMPDDPVTNCSTGRWIDEPMGRKHDDLTAHGSIRRTVTGRSQIRRLESGQCDGRGSQGTQPRVAESPLPRGTLSRFGNRQNRATG